MTDVAAPVMRRLFHKLLAAGPMVATQPLSQLYLTGIQRQSFVPFIGDLDTPATTTSSRHRLPHPRAGVQGGARARDANEATAAHIDQLFDDLACRAAKGLASDAQDRRARAGAAGGQVGRVARFTFDDLCGKLLAPPTTWASKPPSTPSSSPTCRSWYHDINQVRRLITLVDALYDKHVKLVVSAAAPPGEIFDPHDGAKAKNAGDARRPDRLCRLRAGCQGRGLRIRPTASRLNEMQFPST